jgi:peptide/nickel transport system permease protein
MTRYLLRRLAQSLVAILGVVTIVFFVQRLAGDPVLLLVPEGATRADIDLLRAQLGFDRPLLMQFLDYLGQLLRFDLGHSIVKQGPVWQQIAPRLPYTLALAGGALLVAVGIGVPVGVAIAMRREGWIARPLMALVLVCQSLPTFWSGILMILLFAVTWGVLPSSGSDGLAALVMPSAALGFVTMATYARVTRSAVLEELSKDYVRTGRAKGLPPRAVLLRHVARNATIPLVSISAIEIANLLAGAVIVETVFAWPGLGQLAVQSIEGRDFPVVQGIVLLGAVVSISLNLVADLLYSAVDPRIRLEPGRA